MSLSRFAVRWSRIAFASVAGGTLLGFLLGWLLWRSGPAPAALPDPRLTHPSAIRSVRPEVAYVDEDRCTKCHADIAAKYRKHPMGQALWPVAGAPEVEDYSAAAQPTLQAP